MNRPAVYLDYAAAEPPLESVKEYIRSGVELFFNPSSIYQRGRYNWQLIENVREKVAKTLNCKPEQVFFTSGCSESNSTVIKSHVSGDDDDCIALATPIEHSSILDTAGVRPAVPIDEKGSVVFESDDGDTLDSVFKLYKRTQSKRIPLTCVQHANNEMGVIQDIKKVSKICHSNDSKVLVDAAQTFGKIPIDVQDIDCDYLTASAGKCGGIRGCGIIYAKDPETLKSMISGAQERGVRGGTYNDLAIISFGKAIDEIDYKVQTAIRSKRNYLIAELLKIKGIALVGKRANRLANNVFITIKGMDIESQQLVTLLDMYGFMVSAGSACHAGDAEISHVLRALGYNEENAKTCLRITLGKETTIEELNMFIDCLKVLMKMHKTKEKK